MENPWRDRPSPVHNVAGNYVGSVVAGGSVKINQKIVNYARRHPIPFAVIVVILLVLLGWGGYATVNALSTSENSSHAVVDLRGHSQRVRGVAFSPDGRTVATTSDDQTARLWDGPNATTIHVLSGHTGPVWGVAFSPDGRTVATASADGTARLWDTATGQTTRTFTGHGGSVWDVAFNPNGTILATTSDDHTTRLWDMATGVNILTVTGHSGPVFGVAFSPDGRTIATASRGAVLLSDVATGETTRTLTGEYSAGVAFSPDGKILATVSNYNSLSLLTLASGKAITRSVIGPPADLAFSPDGQLIVFTTVGGATCVWHWTTDHPPGNALTGMQGLAFSPDGTRLITAEGDDAGVATLWTDVGNRPSIQNC